MIFYSNTLLINQKPQGLSFMFYDILSRSLVHCCWDRLLLHTICKRYCEVLSNPVQLNGRFETTLVSPSSTAFNMSAQAASKTYQTSSNTNPKPQCKSFKSLTARMRYQIVTSLFGNWNWFLHCLRCSVALRAWFCNVTVVVCKTLMVQHSQTKQICLYS